MILRFNLHIAFCLFLLSFSITAQETTDTLPPVFMIGEYEVMYNNMISQQPDLLMTVCDNNMDQAYSNWLNFLVEVENFAIESKVDINGVKLWINVFWNEDGSIGHIAYYPKPNSKNMEYGYITALLKEFIDSYQSDLTHNKTFCHYGSASFPSFITSSKKVDK